MNATALAAEKRRIAAEAQNIVDTKSMTNGQKMAALDRLDAAKQRIDAESAVLEKAFGTQAWSADSGAGSGATAASLSIPVEARQALFKSMQDGTAISVKAATTTGTVDPATHSGQILPPVTVGREVTRILDVLPTAVTNSAVQEFYTVAATGAAGVTAEGAQKPESTIALTRQMVTAEKIAVWSSVTEEAMTDFPAFEQVLKADLVGQIIDRENSELLNGTGTAPSTFKGLLQVTGTQAVSATGGLAGASPLDLIGAAADVLRVGGRYTAPTAILMHPTLWGQIRRAKTTGDGNYLIGAPTEAANMQLWGLPVVVTTQIATTKVVVADFAQAATAYIRAGLTLRTNPNGSGFRNNVIEVVAEERLALAVTAPSAIAVVTLT